MVLVDWKDIPTVSESERAIGEVRWVLIAEWGNPHPRRKLQQAWEITTYEDGKVSNRRAEWRDVPLVKVEETR